MLLTINKKITKTSQDLLAVFISFITLSRRIQSSGLLPFPTQSSRYAAWLDRKTIYKTANPKVANNMIFIRFLIRDYLKRDDFSHQEK